MASFDVAPFRALASLPRAPPSPSPLARFSPFRSQFSFEPSDVLLQSHAWTLRAGHQMDSSLVLWHKEWQPRATAILAAFLAVDAFPFAAVDDAQQQTLRRRRKPPPLAAPSYGDKELYFLSVRARRDAVRVHAARRRDDRHRRATGRRRPALGAVWRRAALRPRRPRVGPAAALHQQRRHALVGRGRDATVSLGGAARLAVPGVRHGSRAAADLSVQRVGAGADTSAGRSGCDAARSSMR
ncbi:hypothetical protein PINS_up011807 [Pythium insidiosum]|nr:hypothetical protein PINS_up011807 [Pythium insidiosum]